jgi:hypothetical protein
VNLSEGKLLAFPLRQAVGGGCSSEKKKNRGINRQVSPTSAEILEFCPKSANFPKRTGENRGAREIADKYLHQLDLA